MNKWSYLAMMAGILLLSGTTATAAEPAQEAAKVQSQDKTQLQAQPRQRLGKELMSPEERAAQRNRMREATTAEERERLREEHHEQMKARAQEQGVSLPDSPPARQGGMGGGANRR